MNTAGLNETLVEVTQRIAQRSAGRRGDYLERIAAARAEGPNRTRLSCGNLAHGFAACGADVKLAMRGDERPNIAIVSAYNDVLSAHQPLEGYPALLKQAAWEAGGIAQFAGGVPAMCDGVTQGQPGMELSLFSRDVIALATAVALTHNLFDGGLYLGVCDKIVPGLLMGALSFGHLPAVFVPAGPMPSGLSNPEKTRVRQRYAEGKATRDELLEAEAASYHTVGTCTFYGTANTNQLLMEFMGLHVPGASFVNPGTPLRTALTRAAAARAVALSQRGESPLPLAAMIDERTIVNAIVGLLASGGSTNHTIHLVAIAASAGIEVNWNDFADLSAVVPLLARVYPNGIADVNHFHAAGGIAFLIRELLTAGLLHADVDTVVGRGLEAYTREAYLADGTLAWRDGPAASAAPDVLRGVEHAFDSTGGLQLLSGNLGRAIMKVSSIAPERRTVRAPARVFESQEDVLASFRAGELDRDVVIVVRHQGPRANGMPELHKLTPSLTVLQHRGYAVALVTDGRMSGASGQVPAAIQLSPEALDGGAIAKVADGDEIVIDAAAGRLELRVDAAALAARPPAPAVSDAVGFGRELFARFRASAASAEAGGSPLLGG